MMSSTRTHTLILALRLPSMDTHDDLSLVEVELHLGFVKVLDHEQPHHPLIGHASLPVLRRHPSTQVDIHFFAELETNNALAPSLRLREINTHFAQCTRPLTLECVVRTIQLQLAFRKTPIVLLVLHQKHLQKQKQKHIFHLRPRTNNGRRTPVLDSSD